MQNSDNKGRAPHIKLKSHVKLTGYVYKELIQVCPFCNSKTEVKSYKDNRRKFKKASISTCNSCKKHFITYKLFRAYTDKFVCLNPKDIQRIENEITERIAGRVLMEKLLKL